MHRAALDAAELRPLRMSTPVGQTCDALQAIDAVAGGHGLLAQQRLLLQRAARLAAIIAIGDVERIFIGQRGLDARPRAHIGADLLAHVAGQHVGREGQDADPHIGDERRLDRSPDR